jgi:hypothetical protein
LYHAGLPGEKGAGSSGKCAKKLVLLAIPTLASTFSFSVTHLLSAVRAALLVSYGEDPSEYRSDLPQESFGLDLPYGMSLEGSLLGQSEQSPAGMGDETADGKETDMEPKSKLTFSVPFAEVVRRVQANPGDIHILETVEPLQVYLGSFVSNSDRVPSLQCCVTIEYCLMQLCGLVLF